jgi:recombination protein RecT
MTRWLKKTVLRNMLSKWGILSIDMQRAYVNDIDDPEQAKEVIDVEWSEIIEEANVANSPEQQEIVFEQW